MTVKDIINYLEPLTDFEIVKVNGADKERLIFKHRDEIFNIFGSENKEVLNPFNDYSYDWLHTFLCNVVDFIKNGEFETLTELEEAINENIPEWADSTTDVYTSDLTEWLHDNNNNQYYLSEASKEGSHDNLLMVAQYKAIEELFYNALNCLMDDLKTKFSDLIQ